ncbi:MAG: PHP domain-containing protein, partial [Pseudomonadota bacterium]
MTPELCALTNFTFLTGASHPEEMARRAAELGLSHIAVTDVNSVAGVVRAHVALRDLKREGAATIRQGDNVGYEDVRERALALAKRNRDPKDDSADLRAAKAAAREGSDVHTIDGPTKPEAPALEAEAPILSLPQLIPGARLRLADGWEITALPTDRPAWGRLTRLLTLGKRRASKGGCILHLKDVEAWREGMRLILHPPCPLGAGGEMDGCARLLKRLAAGGAAALALAPRYDGRDRERFTSLAKVAREAGAPLAATSAPIMHRARRRQLADVLTCVREGTTI